MKASTIALSILTSTALAACSSPAEPRILVVVTVDWEGAYFSDEGLDALARLRTQINGGPITHFVSAAYFTKPKPDPAAAQRIAGALGPDDELGVHLHAWRSLAVRARVEPKVSPSFLSGTPKVLEFEDDDVGFDTDLDVYSVVELRSLLRVSRTLLEQVGRPVSHSFRAGGNLATPKMLRALCYEGYAIDSSMIDPKRLAGGDKHHLMRLAEIQPEVDTEPRRIELPGCRMLELPIAAIADYAKPEEVVAAFEAANARRAATNQDVVVVLGLNQETAVVAKDVFGKALETALARYEVVFVTITQAGAAVRDRFL